MQNPPVAPAARQPVCTRQRYAAPHARSSRRSDAGAPPVLYQASKQSKDPRATAQELFKNIPAAEANKSYEVMVSVRELPPQPIRLQSATAPLKGQ